MSLQGARAGLLALCDADDVAPADSIAGTRDSSLLGAGAIAHGDGLQTAPNAKTPEAAKASDSSLPHVEPAMYGESSLPIGRKEKKEKATEAAMNGPNSKRKRSIGGGEGERAATNWQRD